MRGSLARGRRRGGVDGGMRAVACALGRGRLVCSTARIAPTLVWC